MERIRERGTVETRSESATERINAVKRVVDNKQYAKIDGECADLFTCGAIMSIYNALNETNRAKYSGLSYRKMAVVAFKLIK